MRIVGGASLWKFIYRGEIIGTSVLQPQEGSQIAFRYDGKMREFRVASVNHHMKSATLRRIMRQEV